MSECGHIAERFEGPDGKSTAVRALMEQALIAGNSELAEAVFERGELSRHKKGELLVEQDACDDDAYFILAGCVDILVNGHHVATRRAGEAVGEMAAIDCAAVRSATVTAAGDVAAWRLASSDFLDLCNTHCSMPIKLARIASDRLRERSKFHVPPNDKPVLFIGSSRESLPVTKGFKEAMKPKKAIEVIEWTADDVFLPSRYAMESLIDQVNRSDFALFVFGPDDKTESRAVLQDAVRDNVVFEMGLFIGRLGRDRVFMTKQRGMDLKIPSDLFGLEPIQFERNIKNALIDDLRPAADRLMREIQREGVIRNRMKIDDGLSNKGS
ncbi:MAG: nucleotide-binding protein [Phycisphaerales bacterium]